MIGTTLGVAISTVIGIDSYTNTILAFSILTGCSTYATYLSLQNIILKSLSLSRLDIILENVFNNNKSNFQHDSFRQYNKNHNYDKGGGINMNDHKMMTSYSFTHPSNMNDNFYNTSNQDKNSNICSNDEITKESKQIIDDTNITTLGSILNPKLVKDTEFLLGSSPFLELPQLSIGTDLNLAVDNLKDWEVCF